MLKPIPAKFKLENDVPDMMPFFESEKRERLALYILAALALTIFLPPSIILVHEFGHVASILLLGGSVLEMHVSWFSGYVVYSGITDDTSIMIVNLSGSASTLAVGLFLLYRVWRYKEHPVIELTTFIWGWGMVILDVVNYSLSDVFRRNGGDFKKVYDVHPYAPLIALIFDIVLVGLISFVVTRSWYYRRIDVGLR